MTGPQDRARPEAPTPPQADGRARIDPAALPMPISRRRLTVVAGLLVAAWLAIAFGRQVAAAAAATDRAEELRGANAALRDGVSNLQDDLASVQDARFIQLMARAYGLGGPGEIPFTLEAGAAAPGPDAPGSAAVRLGARPSHASPLDGWLSVLFGPEE
jgi:cell division protein FtsB